MSHERSLCLSPTWDPGISVVEPADLVHLIGPAGVAQLEEQVVGIDAAITLYGERATVEALRRRGVLVDVPVPDGAVDGHSLFELSPNRATGEALCSGSCCGRFMREHGHRDGFCHEWQKSVTPNITRCERDK